MPRLIDADAYKRVLEGWLADMQSTEEHAEREAILSCICQLDAMQTADVTPVVHARWEWFDEETGTPTTGYEREWGWRCSFCKKELPDDYDDPDCRPTLEYCSNCGAKMRGGGDDEM